MSSKIDICVNIANIICIWILEGNMTFNRCATHKQSEFRNDFIGNVLFKQSGCVNVHVPFEQRYTNKKFIFYFKWKLY